MASPTNFSWLPNSLTLIRCGLAFLVAWMLWQAMPPTIWPFALFVFVAATDFLDGYAARKLNAVSAFGAFLDPVADKLLVGLSLVALTVRADAALLYLIPTVMIVVRDLIATGLRLVPSIEMPVSKLAKWKTALEMLGIGGLALTLFLPSAPLETISLAIVWLAALLAGYTLGLYIGALLADTKRPR